ncbi:MAG: phosphoribosylanthranilate isomerase [Deltaproteobacteria bacterium]|jgi:phosphoribosylanthranilate isomerase|nr:phosphoribosylanthranilate isomerase [Deltaproteobacteria bacterium]
MSAANPCLPLKICGLTRAVDVRLCLDLGVSCTGFIFAPASPRGISPRDAAALPRGRAARVGVFAGQEADEVLRIMDSAALDYAQLHGGEDENFCRAVGPERVIKTIWPERLAGVGEESRGLFPLKALTSECLRFAPVCAFFLLDAGQRGGGGGRPLAWESLRDFRPPRPWILAGGIGPDNLLRALSSCSPWAVDCNSKVEAAPGVKDAQKLLDAAALLRASQTSPDQDNIIFKTLF